MVANALELKGVRTWYFGLETGLHLNGMENEFTDVVTVITDSFRTTKVIRILDSKFHFIKWGSKRFGFGEIENEKGVRRSDKEKTFLDLIYKRFSNRRSPLEIDPDWVEKFAQMFINDLDLNVVRRYLLRYPMWVGVNLRPILLALEPMEHVDELAQIKSQIIQILEKHDIRRASLFGSMVTGRFTDKSDVDLLIEPKEGWSLLDLAGIKIELEEKLGRKVDILTYSAIHPLIRDRILEEMEVII